MISNDDIEAMTEAPTLTMDVYQQRAVTTAIYKSEHAILYPALGLAGEAGEIANKVKKVIRDGTFDREDLAAELGDVLWYVAVLAQDLGVNLGDVAAGNLAKLKSRKARGTIQGSGDKR